MRLDKFLKVSRVIKRRTVSKELALLNKVKVNGKTITELGTKVNPSDQIEVDGEIIKGNSYFDESFITGESSPISKKENDKVKRKIKIKL